MTPNKVNDPVTLTLTFVLYIDFPDFFATVCILFYFTSCSHIYRRICPMKIKITKEQRIKEHKEKTHNPYLEMRRKLKEDSRAYKEFKTKDAIRAKKYRKHLKRKQLADKSKLKMHAIASAIGRNGQSRRGRKAVAAYV